MSKLIRSHEFCRLKHGVHRPVTIIQHGQPRNPVRHRDAWSDNINETYIQIRFQNWVNRLIFWTISYNKYIYIYIYIIFNVRYIHWIRLKVYTPSHDQIQGVTNFLIHTLSLCRLQVLHQIVCNSFKYMVVMAAFYAVMEKRSWAVNKLRILTRHQTKGWPRPLSM